MRSKLHPVWAGGLAWLLVGLGACSSGAPPEVATSGAPAATSTPGTPAATSSVAPTPATATPEQLEPSEPFGLTQLMLASSDGTATVEMDAYVAADPATRQRGLMFREHLPRAAGMVFLFPGEHRGGFWMKDTLIPLSIAFFDADGAVLAVLDMEPCPETVTRCPTYDPGVAYHGALEVSQGYFAELGLEPGWRVTLPPGLAETAS